jgi:hypothetical protein
LLLNREKISKINDVVPEHIQYVLCPKTSNANISKNNDARFLLNKRNQVQLLLVTE